MLKPPPRFASVYFLGGSTAVDSWGRKEFKRVEVLRQESFGKKNIWAVRIVMSTGAMDDHDVLCEMMSKGSQQGEG